MNIKATKVIFDSYGYESVGYYIKYLDYRTPTFSIADYAIEEFIKESKFNSSWDWLMPVWTKLNTDVANWGKTWYVDMCTNSWYMKAREMGFGMGDIDIAYKGILDGIQWYNERTFHE